MRLGSRISASTSNIHRTFFSPHELSRRKVIAVRQNKLLANEEGSETSTSSSKGDSASPWRGDLSIEEVKEKYLRPVYLPVSFLVGTLTFGIKTAADNFSLMQDPLSFIGCAVVSGLITAAIAWVLFDFTDSPPSSGNFSSPE